MNLLAGRTGGTGRGWILLGLVAAVSLMGAGSGDLVPLRRVEALPERDGVQPGATLALAVRITLNHEFHVNSHVPSQEYLIPTAVEGGTAEGLEFGGWEYPEGTDKKFPFSPDPIRVYEGTFLVRGTVRAGADAAAGPRHSTLRLRYQACTREKCLPPKVEEIPVSLPVVAAGTPTRALHPDLFPPAKP
jgi:hypothetical protein